MNLPLGFKTLLKRYEPILTSNLRGQFVAVIGLPFSGRLGFLKVFYRLGIDCFRKSYPKLTLHFLSLDQISSFKIPSVEAEWVHILNITGLDQNENYDKLAAFIAEVDSANWEYGRKAIVINLYLSPDLYLFNEDVKRIVTECQILRVLPVFGAKENLQVIKYIGKKFHLTDIELTKVKKYSQENLYHYYLTKMFAANGLSEHLSSEVYALLLSSLYPLIRYKTAASLQMVKKLGLTQLQITRFIKTLQSRGSKIADPQLFLTEKESIFLKNLNTQNQTISKESLSTILWGEGAIDNYSEWAIQKFVSRFRNKLKKINPRLRLITVKGVGYKLCKDE